MKLSKGSRKVALFSGIVGLGTVVLLFGKIDGAQWVDLLKWTFGPAAVALSAEHFGKGKQE